MERIAKEKFEPLGSLHSQQSIGRPARTLWQDKWDRLKQNNLAICGLVILCIITILSIIAPVLSSHDYETQHLHEINLKPSMHYFFGTDDFGRDLWVRVWWGVRISLFIGMAAAILDMVIGVLYGGISAYYGGRIDMIMQRIVEVVYSIPFLLVTILLMMFLGPGIKSIIIAYAITGWVSMARLVRGQVLMLKEQDFILAARTLGASPLRIIGKHLIPNAMGIIIIQITFVVPSAIFVEAFLSFIGLGIRPPLASLGNLLADGATYMRYQPHRLLFPAAVFGLILLSFNLLGDGLRDALDPRMRK